MRGFTLTVISLSLRILINQQNLIACTVALVVTARNHKSLRPQIELKFGPI